MEKNKRELSFFVGEQKKSSSRTKQHVVVVVFIIIINASVLVLVVAIVVVVGSALGPPDANGTEFFFSHRLVYGCKQLAGTHQSSMWQSDLNYRMVRFSLFFSLMFFSGSVRSVSSPACS